MSGKFISIEKNETEKYRKVFRSTCPWVQTPTTGLQAAIRSLKNKKLHTLIM